MNNISQANILMNNISQANILIFLFCIFLIFLFLNEFFMKSDYSANEDFNNTKIKIYNFNTTWCGHSLKFQPIWDSFSKSLDESNNIVTYVLKLTIYAVLGLGLVFFFVLINTKMF
jgi:hypothetical protein